MQTVMAAEDTSARKARIPKAKASASGNKAKDSVTHKKPTGRPSSYTPEAGKLICDILASGKPLTPTVLKENGLPPPQTVYRWTEDVEGFREQYTRARQYQAHVYADQNVELADTAKDANLARIQVDTRKWYASKVIPKIYGDKQEVEVNHNIKIAEEHAAALLELSRRKRDSETKLIDVTPTKLLEE